MEIGVRGPEEIWDPKGESREMEVDQAETLNRYAAFWDDEDDEIECAPCDPFHRP